MSSAPTNNFNLMRLVAAWLILFGHCYNLYDHSTDPVHTVLGLPGATFYALACFFTISGYLVTASWLRQPHFKTYGLNRILRIFPGLAVMILLCILVLGPLVSSLSAADYFKHPDTLKYARGMFVFGLRYNLPGVFDTLPYANVVNGSLWSLKLEVQLYIALAILAVCRLLRPALLPLIALGLLAGSVALAATTADATPSVLGIKYGNLTNFTFWGFFFAAGSSLRLLREKIAFSALLLGAACIASFASYYLMPHGYYLHALLLPYVIIGLALHAPVVNWKVIQKNDLSYGIYLYAFPIQQTYLWLVADRYGMGGFIAIATLATFIAAWLSWHFVESKILALKPSRKAARDSLISGHPDSVQGPDASLLHRAVQH